MLDKGLYVNQIPKSNLVPFLLPFDLLAAEGRVCWTGKGDKSDVIVSLRRRPQFVPPPLAPPRLGHVVPEEDGRCAAAADNVPRKREDRLKQPRIRRKIMVESPSSLFTICNFRLRQGCNFFFACGKM